MTDDGNSMNDELIERVTQALEQGNKIQAIKVHRELTGSGLKESKEFIDALVPGLVEKDPQRFGHLSQKGRGCGTAALVLMAVGSAATVVFW